MFIIGAGQVRTRLVRAAVKRLQFSRASLVGTVITRFDARSSMVTAMATVTVMATAMATAVPAIMAATAVAPTAPSRRPRRRGLRD